ncbi:MAG: hypothetical protein JJU45_11950, partial [Acidimicrobiia bacterium]|nr:hypothetical protein [Acidimicrobiia bacterium]
LAVTGGRTGDVDDPAATLAENPGLLGSSSIDEGEVTGVRTVGTVTIFDIRPGTMGMVGYYPLGGLLLGDGPPVVEC